MRDVKLLIGIALMLLLTSTGSAFVIKTGQALEVKADEVIDDDLFAAARNIVISGKVHGDVWAFGQDVTVTGEIDGSIIACAANVNINTKRTRTAIIGGGSIKISGPIEKNLILLGGELVLDNDCLVGKDLIAFGGQMEMNGRVQGKIRGSIGDFAMAGKSGDVDIKVETAKVKTSAIIAGDLIVRSEQPPIIESGAQISGETRLERPKPEEAAPVVALAPFLAFIVLFAKIVFFIAKFVTGIIMIALFRNFMRRTVETLVKTPWKSLGWGFLGMIVIPIAVAILFMVLIGYPFALLGIYLFTILFYLAGIVVSLAIGEKLIQIFKKEGTISLYLSFLVGIIVIILLGLIPILGWFVKIAVILFGAGACLFSSWQILKEMRQKELI